VAIRFFPSDGFISTALRLRSFLPPSLCLSLSNFAAHHPFLRALSNKIAVNHFQFPDACWREIEDARLVGRDLPDVALKRLLLSDRTRDRDRINVNFNPMKERFSNVGGIRRNETRLMRRSLEGSARSTRRDYIHALFEKGEKKERREF